MGLRLRSNIAPAAKWASAAIVAPDIAVFANVRPPLPFVVDREMCHGVLDRAGVCVSEDPDDVEEQDAKDEFLVLRAIHVASRNIARCKQFLFELWQRQLFRFLLYSGKC